MKTSNLACLESVLGKTVDVHLQFEFLGLLYNVKEITKKRRSQIPLYFAGLYTLL